MNIINCCPHPITFSSENGSEMVFPKSPEHQARVEETAIRSEVNRGDFPIYLGTFGAVTGLPDPEPGVLYLVSGLVLAALKDQGCRRTDVLSPGTGPGDNAIRNEKGHIQAVTRFKGLI